MKSPLLSRTVRVGNLLMGGNHPVVIQSMTNTDTLNTQATVEQSQRLFDLGCRLVRITAPGLKEARNLENIKNRLVQKGYTDPLCADIHFLPEAASVAAQIVEKVRINPGNYCDHKTGKTEFSPAEQQAERQRIGQRIAPLLEICKQHGTAIRIGVNQGSLSERMISLYGNTPLAMVESALEFTGICHDLGFDQIVVSMKSSRVEVMDRAVRLLARRMEQNGLIYPLHLGVTEAGNGEDGRVKSALGIGALLHQGVGDTIRVSLSEEPEAEIPVARRLVDYVNSMATAEPTEASAPYPGFNPVAPERRKSSEIDGVGGGKTPKAFHADNLASLPILSVDADLPSGELIALAVANPDKILALRSSNPNQAAAIQSAAHILTAAGVSNPIISHLKYDGINADDLTIYASADFGALLLNSGLHDAIWLEADSLTPEQAAPLELSILQAARLRFTRTEYISCPGCGRTMFDLQKTVNEIKAATSHLPHLKIGVMGCIVNGPGEMADADYGYIGAGVGRVSLYRGKECIERNIPSDQALPRLLALLEADGHFNK